MAAAGDLQPLVVGAGQGFLQGHAGRGGAQRAVAHERSPEQVRARGAAAKVRRAVRLEGDGVPAPDWIEVEAIVSHDAVALRAVDGGRRGEITVATDARRRELFVSQYTVMVDGNWQRTDGPIVVARDEVLADEADASTVLLADSIDAEAIETERD